MPERPGYSAAIRPGNGNVISGSTGAAFTGNKRPHKRRGAQSLLRDKNLKKRNKTKAKPMAMLLVTTLLLTILLLRKLLTPLWTKAPD